MLHAYAKSYDIPKKMICPTWASEAIAFEIHSVGRPSSAHVVTTSFPVHHRITLFSSSLGLSLNNQTPHSPHVQHRPSRLLATSSTSFKVPSVILVATTPTKHTSTEAETEISMVRVYMSNYSHRVVRKGSRLSSQDKSTLMDV
jgi:hypothetical protein